MTVEDSGDLAAAEVYAPMPRGAEAAKIVAQATAEAPERARQAQHGGA